MKRFLKAMFCVTFFSVATRALGFFLKIYLSRELGLVDLGTYQVAMSLFGVLMTFVSSGIPVVLSRNVSFYAGKNDSRSTGSIVSAGLILTGIICLIVSIVVVFFPNVLNLIFSSTASSEMLFILLPALVSTAIYEVLRGALWGQQEFFAISFTEFIEQVFRIAIIIILFKTTLVNVSATNKTALSLSIACVLSALIVVFVYFKKGGKLANPKPEFKKLLKTSTPITAVRTMSSVVSSIIAIIIPFRLMKFGYSSEEALSEFGIIMGMSFPLIMIPSTLIGSLAVTIVPSISKQSNDIDKNHLSNIEPLKSKINFSINTAIMFSGILMSTFITLGIPICEFLYNNTEAGVYLCLSSVLMLPLGIAQITSSILDAIGLEVKSLKNYAVGVFLLVVSIYVFPKYIGTYAIIVGYLIMYLCISALNIKMLAKRRLVNFKFIKTISVILLISIFSSLLGFFIFNLLNVNLFLTLAICCTATIGSTIALIYVFNVGNFKLAIFKKSLKT